MFICTVVLHQTATSVCRNPCSHMCASSSALACRCSTPLMRERGTRQVFCVACNLPVRLEQPTPASGASTDRSTRTDVAAQQPQEQQQQQDAQFSGAPGMDAPGTVSAVTAGAGAGAEAAGLRALVQPARQSVAQAAVSVAASASQARSKQQVSHTMCTAGFSG